MANDVSRPDFIVGAALPASGTRVLLGTDQSTEQSALGVVIARPFSVQPMIGHYNLSITFYLRPGSTAVGTLNIEGTDFPSGNLVAGGTAGMADVFGTPGTGTNAGHWASIGTVAVTTGGDQSFWFSIPNIAVKYVRVTYTATSGTGTLDAALTARNAG